MAKEVRGWMDRTKVIGYRGRGSKQLVDKRVKFINKYSKMKAKTVRVPSGRKGAYYYIGRKK